MFKTLFTGINSGYSAHFRHIIFSAIIFLNWSHGAWHVVFGGFSNIDFFIHLVQSAYMACSSRTRMESVFWAYIFLTVVVSCFVFHAFGVSTHHAYYHHPINFVKWPAFVYCGLVQGLALKDKKRYSWKLVAMCLMITVPAYFVSLQSLHDGKAVSTETVEMLCEVVLMIAVMLFPNYMLWFGTSIAVFKILQLNAVLDHDGYFGFADVLTTSEGTQISLKISAFTICAAAMGPSGLMSKMF